MLVAKITISIRKTVQIFWEYDNGYSNACNNANKNKLMLISMYINMQLELITIASAGVNISVRCLIFFIYFKLKIYFNEQK